MYIATAQADAHRHATSALTRQTQTSENFPALRAVERLERQLQRLQTVDTSAASAQALSQGLRGPAIGEHIRRVQEEALDGT
jgi:hypothetical protein